MQEGDKGVEGSVSTAVENRLQSGGGRWCREVGTRHPGNVQLHGPFPALFSTTLNYSPIKY